MKRKLLSLMIAVVFVFALVPSVSAAVTVGQVIKFGNYDWRVLEVKDGRALLLSDKVLEQRRYHDTPQFITWAESDMRAYLNGEFFNSFNEADRARVVQVTNTNPDNPWWGTAGGEDTDDYIFLLSLDELIHYFGDADQLIKPAGEREYTWGFYGAHADARIAPGQWWWLRSPGGGSGNAAGVNDVGGVDVGGVGVASANLSGSVRPALWVDMKQPADTGAGGVGAAAALFLVGAVVCINSAKRKKM
ncbi:MAG: DUF6273 domain-containing protein [Oscillospiraceae bacterium]|nr:DUF6273 domain-containing protein [Oscillospiraceae bacterium]